MNRREFISRAGLAIASTALPAAEPHSAQVHAPPGSFDFVFMTDTHIRPELAAADGCAMAISKIRSLNPAFVIQGGDHIDDALGATHTFTSSLFDLYTRTEQALRMQVYHKIVNHDVFGVSTAAFHSDPAYGKRMYEDRFGGMYFAFDHGGYHFVILDSIRITDNLSYEARIDSKQLEWLTKNLASLPTDVPVILVSHVPLVMGALSYSPPREDSIGKISVLNAWQVLPLLETRNVPAVFQGHTHINEVVSFRNIPFVSCGAVCGNWWHGSRWRSGRLHCS